MIVGGFPEKSSVPWLFNQLIQLISPFITGVNKLTEVKYIKIGFQSIKNWEYLAYFQAKPVLDFSPVVKHDDGKSPMKISMGNHQTKWIWLVVSTYPSEK